MDVVIVVKSKGFTLVVPLAASVCGPSSQPLPASAQAPAGAAGLLARKAQHGCRPEHPALSQPFSKTLPQEAQTLDACRTRPPTRRGLEAPPAHHALEMAIPCKPLYLGLLD